MYTTNVEKIREQLSRVLAIIEQPYINALLTLHKNLAKKNIEWAVSGELGEALRTVQVKPDCVEIVTSKKGAAQIFLAVQEHSPTGVYFQTHRLPRNAELGGKEYPVYVRSHYFDFAVDGVKVKVYGDLQFKIADYDWGDKLEFTPEHIYLVGLKTAVVPLAVKYAIYQSLGWEDRAGKIRQVIAKSTPNLR
jgi:hypothetical protein